MEDGKKMRLRKKSSINKLIEECYWYGFQQGLGDGLCNGLEYTEHPLQLRMSLDRINEVRAIAEKAGYDHAQELLEAATKRRANGQDRFYGGFKYEVPGAVYAECYGAARIFK